MKNINFIIGTALVWLVCVLFFCGTAIGGTYYCENEKGELVRCSASNQTDASKTTVKFQEYPGSTPANINTITLPAGDKTGPKK